MPDQGGFQQAVFQLRQILKMANGRLEAQQKAKDESEAQTYARQNAEVVMPMSDVIYVSIDGDSIGNRVAQAEEKDDEKLLGEISARINSGQDVFRQWAERFGGKMIEGGGDEGLVKVPSAARSDIENMRDAYFKVVGATATVGVGDKISQCTRARELGKLRGKNQTVYYFQGLEQELQSRLEEEGPQDERTKMQAAGLASPVDHGSVPKWGVPPEAYDEEGAASEEPQEDSQEEPEEGEAPETAEGEAPPQEDVSEENPEDDNFEEDEDARPSTFAEEHPELAEATQGIHDRAKKARDFEKKTGIDVGHLTSLIK
jgi:hypothetical protein